MALKISREEWERGYGDPDGRLRQRIADLEAYITDTPVLIIDPAAARLRSEPEAIKYAQSLLAWRERGKALGVVKE